MIKNINNLFKSKYKKALVTGGAGFIGSHLCEELIETGIEVISIDDFSAGKLENVEIFKHKSNFSSFNCDITNKKELETFIDGVDIIFHNAASKKNICLEDPQRDLEVNAKGVLLLLELAKKYDVKKFVHASTGSVYGEPVEFPQTENHPLNPVSYYGVSKLAGERYVNLYNKLFGLDTTILRYFHVYGSRQESNEFGGVVSIFIRNLSKGQIPVIYGDGEQERSFTYVKDLVKANLLVSVDSSATGEVYNCASGIKITINELCKHIIEIFDKSGKTKPKYEDWLIGDIKKFDVSNSKISSLGIEFEKDFFKLLEDIIETEIKRYV